MTFQEGDIVVAVKDSIICPTHYTKGSVGVVVATGADQSKVQFNGWTGWPYDNSYIRKATPVEAAEYTLKQAQVKLDEAKKAEAASAEAKRKAEEEAKRFTEADVKSFTIVDTSKHSGRGALRMVIVSKDQVLFINQSGGVSWTEPRDSAVAFMNSMYYKTSATTEDFFNV
jgi:hypothetical protein